MYYAAGMSNKPFPLIIYASFPPIEYIYIYICLVDVSNSDFSNEPTSLCENISSHLQCVYAIMNYATLMKVHFALTFYKVFCE